MTKASARVVLRFAFGLGLAVALAACGSSGKKDKAPEGERISVIAAVSRPRQDPGLADFRVELPEPAVNRDWAQAGGTPDHAPGNAALAKAPDKIWSASIGSGSGKNYKLIGRPVIGGNAAYTLDSIGRVSAYNLTEGDRYWRVETAPPSHDGEAMGGGIALEGSYLYVTTGFGEVLALRASDGAVVWRRMIGKPLRAAPTVFENRVFVVTIENETHAIDARTGNLVWHQSGIAESAALMGASSPAVKGDTVAVAYSSGELFALRAQNGRVVWGEVLAVPTQKGALPAIADIRGAPVIDRGRVYAISHSGRMVAIEERSGERVWESDIGGKNTPCAVGNAVFVVTNENELLALTRDGGRVIWTVQLQKLKDPDNRDSKPVSWFGPIMAGGRLWLTNSLGHLAAYDPQNGGLLLDREVGDPFFMPPVVAERTMLLLSDDGTLRAFK